MSTSHLILLLVICVIIFGPSRLENVGVSLGKAIRGFKKGMEEATPEQKPEQKIDETSLIKPEAQA